MQNIGTSFRATLKLVLPRRKNEFSNYMNEGMVYLTPQGHQSMVDELNKLKEKRPQVVKEMDEMRGLGDLAENAGYHDKKRELGFVEGRIMELEETLKKAKVLEPSGSDSVDLGTTVELHLEGDNITYQVVHEAESDISNGKISNSSPLGQALIGKKIGDTVKVASPGGTVTYEVLNIQ